MMSRKSRDLRPRRAPLGRALLLLGAAALSGCYAHTPVGMGTLEPRQRVRVHLAPAAAAEAAAVLGAQRPVLDGVLTRATPEEIWLLVPTAYVQAGLGSEALRQELRFAREDVVALQRRQLDRVRTGALLGMGAAVVSALVYRALSGESGGTTTPPPGGGPPEARLPGGWGAGW